MNNQMTIQGNSNMQMKMPLEEIKEINIPKKPHYKKLLFQPYLNRQSFAIYDIDMLIPEHHVARLVDKMVESIPDQVLYAHYTGGGRASYHPKFFK